MGGISSAMRTSTLGEKRKNSQEKSTAREGDILNQSDLICDFDEKPVRSGEGKKNITSLLTTFFVFPYIVKPYFVQEEI